MHSRYRIVDADAIYFVTSTIVEWLPVFTRPREAEIVLASLAYCRAHKGLRLYAYVIMENHVHLVAEAPDLSATMQAFKRHTAKALLESSAEQGREWLLNQFAFYKKKHKAASNFQVWQEGVHPQLIRDDAMLRQKITYIHNNPVRRGWVEAPEHWRYSSARNYLSGGPPVLEIDPLPGQT